MRDYKSILASRHVSVTDNSCCHVMGPALAEKNRYRKIPTDHHHVFDRPAINGHGLDWESACFRWYQRGDATDPCQRRKQDEEETLTRSSLQPDPNRSPDRRLEKKIQSFSINSTIFDLSA
ncbi:hypothetical protein HID58_078255 [Brassica napus]|uniref:Uncharacterized protein n=1 Tax=Brassica napus TaxID=3708 RepID=A0ABQ7YSP0_BRANA|nr:hypothetical protein HID58_078255 [Brassica napus]